MTLRRQTAVQMRAVLATLDGGPLDTLQITARLPWALSSVRRILELLERRGHVRALRHGSPLVWELRDDRPEMLED